MKYSNHLLFLIILILIFLLAVHALKQENVSQNIKIENSF